MAWVWLSLKLLFLTTSIQTKMLEKMYPESRRHQKWETHLHKFSKNDSFVSTSTKDATTWGLHEKAMERLRCTRKRTAHVYAKSMYGHWTRTFKRAKNVIRIRAGANGGSRLIGFSKKRGLSVGWSSSLKFMFHTHCPSAESCGFQCLCEWLVEKKSLK